MAGHERLRDGRRSSSSTRAAAHIPIIFITAVSRDAAHVFRGYSHGAVDYLVKPFDADILRSKAAVFVELYLQGREAQAAGARCCASASARRCERKSQQRYRRLLDVDAPVHLGGGRRAARSTTGTAPALDVLRAQRGRRARASRSGSACTPTIAPRRAPTGRRRCAAASRFERAGAAPARRRRQLPLAPRRARCPSATSDGAHRRLDRDRDRHRRSEARGGGAAQGGHPARRLPVGRVARAAHAADVAEAGGREPVAHRARGDGTDGAPRADREGREDRCAGGAPAPSDRRAARRVAHRRRAARAARRGGRSRAGRRRGRGALQRRGRAASAAR